jgi:CubicO group peptidase (beta-lactamase class C family)
MGEPAPFQEFGRSDGDTPISGTVKPGFEAVRDAFAANLDSGADIGAAAAVFIDGEPVVDLWGGYFDATYTRLWERDTIANGFSSTKTMTALCALLLADRGELDLNAPVKKYWPEFAAAGKERVEVRHLLGHASGVAGWSEPMTLADIYDWEKATTLLARQAPWWEPGTAGGYHAFNMGHLVGEVIRRITDLTTGEFLRVELAGRLNVEYYIGTPAERDGNVSLLIQGYPIQPKGNEFFKRALLNPPARPQDSWSIAWRRADLGALNGHGNAYAPGLAGDAGMDRWPRDQVGPPGRALGRRRRFDGVCRFRCPHGVRIHAESVDHRPARTGSQHERAQSRVFLPRKSRALPCLAPRPMFRHPCTNVEPVLPWFRAQVRDVARQLA